MREISFAEFETAMAKNDRKERRIFIVVYVLLGLFLGSNLMWIIHFFG